MSVHDVNSSIIIPITNVTVFNETTAGALVGTSLAATPQAFTIQITSHGCPPVMVEWSLLDPTPPSSVIVPTSPTVPTNSTVPTDPTVPTNPTVPPTTTSPTVPPVNCGIYFIYPPVIYNGLPFQITIYTYGDFTLNTIYLHNTQSKLTSSSLTYTVTSDQNILNATIPSGSSSGLYTLDLSVNVNGIPYQLTGEPLLRIVDDNEPTISINTTTPTYVSNRNQTEITIMCSDGISDFEELPIVVLSQGPMVNAIVVPFVGFVSSTEIVVTITEGIPTGSYELIVMNVRSPGLGKSQQSIQIQNSSLPTITSVDPYWLSGSKNTLVITGTGLANSSLVTCKCKKPPSTTLITLNVTILPASTYTSMSVTIQGNPMPSNAVCVLTVTNADNYVVQYGGITTKLNAPIGQIYPVSPMVASRNRFALASASIAGKTFLYAIGGGWPPRKDVEQAEQDLFGTVGPWSVSQGGNFPYPLTDHMAVGVDKMIYVAGGVLNDTALGNWGTGVTPTILSQLHYAEVLDPADAPQGLGYVLGLKSQVFPEGEIGSGIQLWYYQVSVIYNQSDSRNPGGESLPSLSLPVLLPNIQGVVVRLSWTPVSRAIMYRVYRTPAPNSTVSTVQLLGVVPYTYFVDTMGAILDANTTSRQLGALGSWIQVLNFASPHAGGQLIVSEIIENPSQLWLHLIGGIDGTGKVDNIIEWATIDPTILPHMVSLVKTKTKGPPPPPVTIPNVYYGGGALLSTRDVPSGQIQRNQIIFSAGINKITPIGYSNEVYLLTIGVDGSLTATKQTLVMAPPMNGYCSVQGASTWTVIGGGTGTVATLTTGMYTTASNTLPNSWNVLNTTLSVGRRYMACLRENGVIIFAGGSNDTSVDAAVQ